MASLLGICRRALRTCVHAGCSGGLALIVAATLLAGTVDAHANALPGINVKQSGDMQPQTPSASAMNVLVPLTIGVAAVGAAAVALPAAGAIAITGDVVAAAGMAAIRSRVIQGAGLIALMATLGGDVSLDKNGNIVAPAVSASAGDPGFDGFQYEVDNGNGVGNSPSAAVTSAGYTFVGIAGTCAGGGCVYVSVKNPAAPQYGVFQVVAFGSGCVAGYVLSSGTCGPDPSSTQTQPATSAQIQNAIQAHPASWPQVVSNSCANHNTLADIPGDGSDPCWQMIKAPSSKYNTVTFPQGSSVALPDQVETSDVVDANGVETKTTTTTQTTANFWPGYGADGLVNRVHPVTSNVVSTTKTQTDKTVTNADGSKTTTTTTTTGTDTSPTETVGTPTTFDAPDISLYKAKTKTFGDVLSGFRTRVAAMPWYAASVGFFNVTIGGGSCPHWTVPATRWSQALDGSVYFCSSTAMTLYQLGGVVVMIVAAWAAFRIGLL